MLCKECIKLLSVVKNHPPGDWVGIKPSLFDYPEDQDTWAGSHHVEPYSFLNAALERCYICSTIYRDCSAEMRAQSMSFRTFYSLKVSNFESARPTGDNHYALEFTIEILDGRDPIAEQQVFDCNGTFKIIPKKEISASGKQLPLTPNTFTGECEEQVRRWLENCARTHVRCTQDWRTTDSSPARLLNVQPTMGDYFRLETLPRNTQPPRYVTLSHCWGAGMTATLTRGNQGDLLNRCTPIISLPRRFQDAVAIARWMRVDYLWIDALCIMQDSKEDWLSESAKMGDIYTNSYCNIAATSADPHKGCFTSRLVSMVEPYVISDPQLSEETATYVLGYDDFWSNSLLDAPLHARGWVLQERLLSPRTIHFGQEQMFWECRCEMACEAYPTGIPQQFRNRRTHAWRQADEMLDPQNTHKPGWSAWQLLPRLSLTKQKQSPVEFTRIYETWSKVVETYMECKLSFPEDKLVAISGIAQKVAIATGERYVAGLWDNSMLAPSLLWYVLGRRQADGTSSIRTAIEGYRGYRAPSWSWASLEAKVICNWPGACEQVLINILKTNVCQAKGSNLGRVLSAQMHIRGSLFKAILSVVSKSPDGSFEEDGRYALQLLNHGEQDQSNIGEGRPETMEPTIYLDTSLMPERTCTEVYLLPVCLGWRGRSRNLTTRLAGLLLAKAAFGTSKAEFVRVGVFGMDQDQTSRLYGERSAEPGFFDKGPNRSDEKTILLV
ncbi:hypothetical protein, variant 2 [Phialophora macrospora]|nr:hypothetical protein, variant 1 [Phialophora macrospora]KIW70259.1 hypothetical protein, variant 2 [Phialophora macrospora]